MSVNLSDTVIVGQAVMPVSVDSELSTTSTNPVQNKVITLALQDKQDVLTAGEGITINDNVISASGGGAPTLTWYTGNSGTTVTIADTSDAQLVKVYRNGVLLQPTEDYTINGTTLTLVTALIETDKITTEVF